MGYCYPSEGILAAKTKKAEFHWRLKLPECVIEDLEEGMTEEEFIQRYMTFTIPSDNDTYQDVQPSGIPQQGYYLGSNTGNAPINCIFVISMQFGKTKPNLYE